MTELATREIETMEAVLLEQPQVDCPVTHHFSPGVYVREIFMPAGTFVIGHEHKTQHQNVVLSGRAKVMVDGRQAVVMQAPFVFESQPGVRKVLYIEEDMRWLTIHPTHETDPEKLEALLISKSRAFMEHQMRDLEQLRLNVGGDL